MSQQDSNPEKPVFETPTEGTVKCNLNPLTCGKRLVRSSVEHGKNYVCTHEDVPDITNLDYKETLAVRSCVTKERS